MSESRMLGALRRGTSSLNPDGRNSLHRFQGLNVCVSPLEGESRPITSIPESWHDTYLLTVLAQLYLGGEQGEGAGRFPSRWFTGWCLEAGGQTDTQREKERELIRQQGGRGGSGSWFWECSGMSGERRWREGCVSLIETVRQLYE